MIPVFFPGAIYEQNKKQLLKLYEQYGVEYNPETKKWEGEKGQVKGFFEGYKKPSLLHIEGSEEFVNVIVEWCKSVGAEIREAEVKDVRDKRKEQEEEKERKKIEEAEEKLREEKLKEESRLGVIQYKVDTMKRCGMNDESVKWWIKKETGAEIEFNSKEVKIIRTGEPDSYSFKDLIKEIEKKNDFLERAKGKPLKPKVLPELSAKGEAGGEHEQQKEIVEDEKGIKEYRKVEKSKETKEKRKSKSRSTKRAEKLKTKKTIEEGEKLIAEGKTNIGACGKELIFKGLNLACPDNCEYIDEDNRCTWERPR